MTKHEIYEKKTEELLTPILEGTDLKLFDVEFVKEAGSYYLRVFLDKESGVTITDCEDVSRPLSLKLDEADFIPETYILEVSSLGLGRALKKEKDFLRALNREIEIRLFKPVDKEKDLIGTLISFDKENITVMINGNHKIIERKNISKIAEYVDFGSI